MSNNNAQAVISLLGHLNKRILTMQKYVFGLSVLLMSILIAQSSPTVVTSVDYSNATRYIGARNSARSTNGNLIVAFEPADGYVNQEIWYSIYNPWFGEFDPAQQLSYSAQGGTGVPSLVADDNGSIYAGWKQWNRPDDTGRDYYMAKWQSGQWGTPFLAETLEENNAGVGTINISSDGSLFNAFSIWDASNNLAQNIYSSRSNDDGATWVTDNLTSEFPTPDTLNFDWVDVSLASGIDGKMYVAWEEKPTMDSHYEVLFAEFNGIEWQTPVVVTPEEGDGAGVLKYVDGCIPSENGESIYEMGPEDYPLAGHSVSVKKDNVLSIFFNLRYMFPEDQNTLIGNIINHYGASSILVVDDDNRYNHESYLISALEANGVNATIYDCGDDGSGFPEQIPTVSDLSGYDLVFWFAGDDGFKLAFWNGQDNGAEEDNSEISSFIENGGKLAVMGVDLLYDRFGSAPDTFAVGDFMYDKLGIEYYASQSYADDGAQGVEKLNLVEGCSFTGIEQITWNTAGKRQGEPSIAGDLFGNVHMVYVEDYHINYQKYNGSTWTNSIQIDANPSPDSMYVIRPCISVADNGGIYVTWNQRTSWQPSVSNVFYTTSSNLGSSFGIPLQLSDATEPDAFGISVKRPTIGVKVQPPIAGVFDGGADVIWTQADPNSQYGYNIMYGHIPYIDELMISTVDGNALPERFVLNQNYPNPFNPTTMLRYDLPEDAKVSIMIYDLMGREVKSLVNVQQNAGFKSIIWDATNDLGQPVSAGVYLYRISAGNYNSVKKMVLLK